MSIDLNGIRRDPSLLGEWSRHYGIVNVKDYGAKGDGITDDAAAIQAALDKGGLIYIPPGIYRVMSSLTMRIKGTILTGAGRGATTIRYPGSIHCIIIEAPLCKVQDLTIENIAGTASPGGGDAIRVHSTSKSIVYSTVIEDVEILNAALNAAAINLFADTSYMAYTQIRNVTIIYNDGAGKTGRDGIRIGGPGAGGANSVTIIGGDIRGANNGIHWTNGPNLCVLNTYIEGNNIGILIDGVGANTAILAPILESNTVYDLNNVAGSDIVLILPGTSPFILRDANNVRNVKIFTGGTSQKIPQLWTVTSSTVGAAGSAAPLPIAPATYAEININGQLYKVPCYNP